MSMNKKYWKGFDEKIQSPEFIEKAQKEFQDDLHTEEFLGDENVGNFTTGRRDFLKFLGFGVAAATLASCETPVIKSVPYVNKPEDITPGVANWYATTFYDGNDYANILVKSREGRPIWVKGNPSHGYTKGGLTPRINASVLNLYNSERLNMPVMSGEGTTWKTIDENISKDLSGAGKIVLMSKTVNSPSTTQAIKEFSSKMGNVEWVQYDATSFYGMREANKASFGENIIPDYNFDKAKTIVSISADFLANWLMPAKYSVDYATTRKPEDGWMSQHYQFESILTLSGANADYRTMIKPSEEGAVAAAILKHLGGSNLGLECPEHLDMAAQKAAEALKNTKGESIVIAGSNNKDIQLIVNSINNLLGNYGKTIDTSAPLNIKQGDDKKVEKVVKDVLAGGVKAIVFYDVNPVYSLPNGEEFGEALSAVPVSISFSQFADETASKCKYICPDHNYLEAWNDYNVKLGNYSIQQPLTQPIFDTRQAQESLLVWAGAGERDGKESKLYYDYIREMWKQYGYPSQSEYATFDEYWNWAVHNGTGAAIAEPAKNLSFTDAVSSAASGLKVLAFEGGFELVTYLTGELGEGQYAANPWLQELPHALTKVTWDNYVAMSVNDACNVLGIEWDEENQIEAYNKLHIGQEDKAYLVDVTVGETTLKLPIYPMPGQAPGTIGIALGYGRGEGNEMIGKAAYQVALDQTGEYILEDDKRVPIGKNAYRLTSFVNGALTYNAGAEVKDAAGRYYLACTQTHHTIMGRDSILKETDFNTFLTKDKHAINHQHELHVHTKGGDAHIKATDVSLWDEHPVEHVGHRWAMSIDLSSCNGCGVCIVACHSENNVPVVGKDEVRRARDMHWLRLDRYFSSIDDDVRNIWNKDKYSDVEWDYNDLEVPEASPRVNFMPMLCQHCNHAPCETVCPVAATTHSNEGLNMMAYNRCIGTRYCGNNCPYKVRRFNWFNYRDYKKFSKVNNSQDIYARMALNPDVTVRSRGVMEKCSFCVQRIQEGKLNAKSEGRPVVDGDVITACSDACPANAITFGDWNDTNSEVRTITEDVEDNKRVYQALEEIGVKPNIYYQLKVRNTDEPLVPEVAHGEHSEEHETEVDEH